MNQELEYDALYQPTISRWFVFRKLWLLIEMWVLIVWAIWILLLAFLHFWYMLFLGRRHETIWKKQLRFMRHCARWQAYIGLLINQRPMFIED